MTSKTAPPKTENKLSGVHLLLVLWRAARAVEEHSAESISAAGLCVSDFAVLEALLHKGAMPINTIGKKVLLTSGSMTTAVDRLERRGLVERQDALEDRRARVVHLTPAGRKLIKRAFADHAAKMERATSALNESERKTVLRLLKKLGYGAAELTARERI